MNYSWELSQFDTDIFGYNVSKITDIFLNGKAREDDKIIKDLIADLKSNTIHYATYRVNANDYSLIHGLEQNGFILVDCIIESEAMTEFHVRGKPHKNIRGATENDLPQLINIARSIFGITRYYKDPVIETSIADAVYQKWIENSVKGEASDIVLVWEEAQEIMGFITLQKKGRIPLVGVSQQSQGKGIGKQLVNAALNQCKKWKTKKVLIDTQLINIRALRVYIACGFKPTNSYVTLRWYNKRR